MADWTAVTEALALNAMPTDMGALYAAWINDNPAKATRLAEIVLETVAVFRANVESNPANIMDADPTKVPTSGFRHALNEILFNLGMEMGVKFSTGVDALNARAQMWLRAVQSGNITATMAGANPTPSYETPDDAHQLLEG